MKNNYLIASFTFIGILLLSLTQYSCSEDEETYEQTRLFRPAISGGLKAIENRIIINLAKAKEASGYKVEVSQDSFKTVAYTVQSDTNYIVLNKTLLGQDLLYNALYQIRVTSIASDPQYNSKVADLGGIRTERFPSIMLLPRVYDVTDVRARVRWTPSGPAITSVKLFAKSDLRLEKPLGEYAVTSAQHNAGEIIIDKLLPSTGYQVAIYSGTTLKGWVDYLTLVAGVDPSGANVVDLSDNDDPNALTAALDALPDGGTILLKKGMRYNVPTANLTKAVIFKGAYGLVPERTSLFTTSDWKVAVGAKINYVVFDDLEFVGEDMAGDYVFNLSNSGAKTIINELRFENCTITNLRGIVRLRSDSFIKDFTISNSVVYNFGNYGVFTCDTDGAGKAAIDNVKFVNSTFYKLTNFVTSRQNVQSFLIDGCTFNEFSQTAQQVFRFRGLGGLSEVINGLTIKNSIFGSGWAVSGTDKSVSFNREGLKATSITITNTWATSDFVAIAGSEMPGFPPATYNGETTRLWVDPEIGNFKFKDNSFAGKSDSGDPRWRVK